MFGLGSDTLGITLLVLGLAIFVLTYIIFRFIPKIRPEHPIKKISAEDANIPTHNEAVFMIQPGGRILYVNQAARNQFKLWEEEPNLEKLARRSRPSDVFWGLCTSEGQSVFQIDGRPYIGTSYFVPNDNGNSILLSLRSQQEDSLGQEDSEAVTRTIEILTTLNASMTAELELEPTLETILKSVEQLIPTDFSEITIWDPDDKCLIPFRFIGIQGIDRRLEKTTDRYPMDKGYSGYLAGKKEPILVPNVDTYQEVHPFIDRKKYPFQSYLGVPLLVREELIGTLELTSREKNAYTEGDIGTMSIIAVQAAIAIHNALIFQQEQRRAEELSSLANFTKAVSSVRDDQELFAHLVQGIAFMMNLKRF